jgi:two-component system, cell cycle sensor histidine kinase and response regulator CckA
MTRIDVRKKEKVKKSKEVLAPKIPQVQDSADVVSGRKIPFDITDYIRAEEALQKSEARYRSLIENMDNGFADHRIIVDEGGKPIDWVYLEINDAYERMIGVTPEQVIGKRESELVPTIRDEKFDWIGIYGKVALEGKPTHFEAFSEALGKWFSVSVYSHTPGYFVTNFSDITERKRTEESLLKSEEFFRTVIEHSYDAITMIASDGTILYDSPSLLRVLGYADEERIGRKVFEFAIPEERHAMELAFAEFARKPGSTMEYCGRFIHKNGMTRWIEGVRSNLLNEPKVRAIVVNYRDITERKLAEEELRKSRQMLADAMDLSNLVNWEFDVLTRIFTFDDRFFALYGTTAEREGGNQMSLETYIREFVHPDDVHIVDEVGKEARQTTDPQFRSKWEHRIIRRDGEIHHIIVSYGITKDENGQTIKTHGANQDITERKLAEEAVRKSDEKYKLLAENSADIIYKLNIENEKFTYVSPSVEKIFGYTPEEAHSLKVSDILTPESYEKNRENLQNALSIGKKDTEIQELEAIKKDGRTLSIEIHTSFIMDEQGNPVEILGVARDITDRKHTEAALYESEDKYRSFVEKAHEAILIAQDGILKYVNPRCCTMLEFQAEDMIERPFVDFIHEEDRELVLIRHRRRIAGEEVPDSYDFRLISSGGKVLWVNIKAARIQWEGKSATLNLLSEITDRKLAEEALRESEEKYRSLHESAGIGIEYYSPDGVILSFNTLAARYMNGKPEDFCGKSIYDIYPKDIADFYFARIKKSADSDIPQEYEDRIEQPGEVKWFQSVLTRIVDRNKKVIGVQKISADLTKSKIAEELLRESEEKYRLLVDHANEIIVVIQDGLIKFINREALEMTGYSEFELMNKPFPEFVHPDDRDMILENSIKRLKGEPVPSRYAFRIVTRDGITKWVEIGVTLIEWQGWPATLNFLTNITDRKKAEEELRESETLQTHLLTNLPVGVVIVDPETRYIESVNAHAASLFGASIDHLAGHRCHSLLCPAAEGACPVLDLGKVVDNSEREMLRADGSGIPILKTVKRIQLHGQEKLLECFVDIIDRKQAEASLHETNELLSMFIKHSPIYAFIKEVTPNESRVLQASENYQDMVGIPGSKMVGKTMEELFPSEFAAKMTSDDLAVVSEDKILKLDEELNGRCYTTIKSPISLGDKKLLVGYTIDITERKRAEEALRESEEKYRNLVEHSIEGIGISKENRIIFANRTLLDMFGYDSLEEFAKIPLLDHVAPESRNLISEMLEKKNLDEIFPSLFEYKIIRKDRKIRDIEISIHGVSIQGEKYTQGTFRDITERKQAEEALRDSEERSRAAFMGSTNSIVISTKEEGIWIDVNQVALDTFGYTQDEVIGTSALSTNLWINLSDRLKIVETLNKNGEVRNQEVQLRHKDGSIIIGLLSVRELTLKGVKHLLFETVDITTRKRAEAEHQKLEAQYLQSQKMEAVGRLAGGVAHDFNNMLSVILGYAEMIRMTLNPADQLYADIQEIITAGKRSADLTRQLLAFARKQTIAPRVIDINDTITGMLKMLRRLIGEDIDLIWKPAGNLWPVKMDPAQINQILANLTVNSRDAISGVGKLSIETDNKEVDGTWCETYPGLIPGQYVMLAVSDNGCGMDKDTRERLFEPFFTTKKAGEGTGLGLAMVYGIVKQNNGYIDVYSEPGKGTTFKIYLPCNKEEEEITSINKPLKTADTPRGTETVLLAEDEEALLKIAKKMLELLGYTVLAAPNPNEAIQLATKYEGEIHLLLTDVVMPEMSGRDLREVIMALRPNMKSLFISGYTADIIAHRGVLDEGIYFLQKPFSMAALAVKMREALSESKKK